MTPRMSVWRDGTGQWRWRLQARNAKIVASGESFTRKGDAVKAALLVLDVAGSAELFVEDSEGRSVAISVALS